MAFGGYIALIGIAVVFTGLYILYMLIMLISKRVSEKPDNIKKEGFFIRSKKKQDSNMDEIAAAISISLHTYIANNISAGITINSNTRSPWKEIQRVSSMQRL